MWSQAGLPNEGDCQRHPRSIGQLYLRWDRAQTKMAGRFRRARPPLDGRALLRLDQPQPALGKRRRGDHPSAEAFLYAASAILLL